MKKKCLYLIIFLLLIFIINYYFQFMLVNGTSMFPTFQGNEFIIVDKHNKNYNIGDIIVFKSHDKEERFYIKRIVAKENDHIQISNNEVIVNGKPLYENYLNKYTETLGNYDKIVPNNEYFVLGDNRKYSRDSRIIGTIKKENIVGKVSFKMTKINSK